MDKIFIEKFNNKSVFCIFSEGNTVRKELVIMCHGFRSSSVGPARTFVDFSKILVAKGYSVLRFDQPNSGNSDGKYIDSSFNEWVDTIVYLTKNYLAQGYEIIFLGQSMGATAATIAASRLPGQINCLLLWVPDPKSTFDKDPNQIYEEGGQKYRGTFWQEAKDLNFFDCLKKYKGKIHLVYGQTDKYVEKNSRKQVIEQVKVQGGEVMILPGQDHSGWDAGATEQVFKTGLELINQKN